MAAAASAADDLGAQMSHLHLEQPVKLEDFPCREFHLKRDEDGRPMKTVDKTILIKKESEYIDNEMKIYAIIKDLPDIPKVYAVYTCIDANEPGDKPHNKYKVIQYELFVPYKAYHPRIRTHAEMMKYFREVFESYVHLIKYKVIHNDLKPENVLFNPYKDKYVVSDFDSSIFAPLLKDNLLNINRDFHRFFDLFANAYKEKPLWNPSLNQAMFDVLQRLNVEDFQTKYTQKAFAKYYISKKTEGIDMHTASNMYVDDYLKFIKENIEHFDQHAGRGGKNRRTIKCRRPSKCRRHRRTNKANKRRRLTKRR